MDWTFISLGILMSGGNGVSKHPPGYEPHLPFGETDDTLFPQPCNLFLLDRSDERLRY